MKVVFIDYPIDRYINNNSNCKLYKNFSPHRNLNNSKNYLLPSTENKVFRGRNSDNYVFFETYYNKTLNKDEKTFDNRSSAFTKELFLFSNGRTQQEVLLLNTKKNFSKIEKNNKNASTKIIKAASFSEQNITTQINSNNISFCGYLTPEQKSKCKLAIHGASAVCASISAIAGEGAAIGADTWFLRGTQALMFFYLKDLLGVDSAANLMYITRQYVMGSYIGVRGAQILIGWLGLGTHAATVGASFGVVSGAVRGINSALSMAITEKMGWGYVKSYEQDAMTAKQQLISSSLYLISLGVLEFHNQSILDPSNTSDVQDALSKISKEDVTIFGHVIHTLTNNINLPRAGLIFATSLLQAVITTKNLDEESKKEYFKNLIKILLLNTVIYETLNIPDESLIKEDALAAIERFKQDLENTPEIFQEFQKIQQEIVDKLNIDDLNTRDFVKQFQKKDFVISLAYTTAETTNILANKWRKRNFSKLKEANTKVNALIAQEKIRTNIINSRLTPEQQKEFVNELNSIIAKTKTDMLSKTRANFALGKIAGYEITKTLLNMVYITPVKNKDENFVPSLMLFYGPSGLGKTTIGSALAEDAGVRFKNKTIGMGDEKKTIEWIKGRLEEGEENYKTSKRFSIIQLNEFDDFLNDNPDLLDEFLKLISGSVKNYHTTFFLTTNNPLLINKKLLSKVDLALPMGGASKSDIQDIVQYYVNNREIIGYNLDEITEEFEKVKPDYMYSNAQIKNIIDNKLPQKQCSQQDFINIIRLVKPSISKEINEKFEKEQKIIKRIINNDYKYTV